MNPNARNGLTEKLCPICQYPEFDPRCPHWGYWDQAGLEVTNAAGRENDEGRAPWGDSPSTPVPAAPYTFRDFMGRVLKPVFTGETHVTER